ncbi:MAG: STN domain-containing protein, partial [Luteolibacter sp.]
LDRRNTKTFPGSMLPRLGLLLHRWTEEDLDQGNIAGSDGDSGSVQNAAVRQTYRGADISDGETHGEAVQLTSVCDFLQFPSVVRFDLKPEADGSLKLPLAQFEGCQFLEIVASDAFASDTLILPLPASDAPLRDRRIARPLDPQAHFLATRSAAVLRKDAEASIENLLDADWRAFTTLSEAQEFLYGMSGDERLREFAFLSEWPIFPEAKRLELLSAHACHEFHLFLARKDTAFFEKHVKPLLAQKPEPTFIDDLLLERDLNSYLRPYAWQRLNAAEKALLSQALPEARERISRELTLRWQLEAPTPDAETQLFTQTLRGSDLAIKDSLGLARRDLQPSAEKDYYSSTSDTTGVAYLAEKLRTIIIPRMDLEDTTVREAIDFLRLRAAELDLIELDPSKKGVNLVIRRPSGAGGNSDPAMLRIKELRLRNVPLATALKYICDQTNLSYKVDDYAVTIVPQSEGGEDLFTRTFRVFPDFRTAMNPQSPNQPIQALLKSAGIVFSEGASASLSGNGALLVTNTRSELNKIEQLTQVLKDSGSPSSDAFAAAESDGILPPLDGPGAAADPLASPTPPFEAPAVVPTFPDRTRLWREANYFKNSKPTDESLIPLNRFWLDLAAWDGKTPFLSPHFNACHTTANEALMCLALLDLPFKAERPEVKVDGSTLRVKAREPMLLFYKDTRRTENVAADSPLLVRQTFSPLAEPFRTVNGRQVENPVTGDFRPGVPYRESLVVTNPTGIGRRIDVLAQIPAGAIPLQGKLATLSSTHELEPYGVVMLELAFYLPAAGDFPVYPMQVSEDVVILAGTQARTLRVSNDPAPVDKASWGVLANEGTAAEVLERLRTENLKTLDLSAIRWRLKDAAFFLDATRTLRERLFFSPAVAAYGFRHNDVAAIREYLENSEAVRQLGDWLDSPLLEVRPRVHHDWATLEFDPLVNARTHRFANESRLTHAAAREHYQAFLNQVGWKPSLDAADHLTLAAFLFLQDRIEEGLARFDRIDPAKLPGRVNYDYLRAVVLFHREKPEEAKLIAAQTLPTLPPDLWRDRFQAVMDQADEIAALDLPVENAKPEPEIAMPRLDLTLSGNGRLVIQHRSLEKAKLRLFSVDLEVLFSKDPFLQGDGSQGGDPAIRPNADLEVPLADDVNETTVDLPEGLRNGNVLVSAESGTKKLLRVLDSRALELRQTPASRTVQVLDAATAKPLPKTYIKVYAEMDDGEVVFHKDGYTDLRGKFDYLSHTAVDPSTVKRVAILASHPEKGARAVIYDR